QDANSGSISSPTVAGQVVLINTTSYSITGQVLNNATVGLILAYSNLNTISTNKFQMNSDKGIYQQYSHANTVDNNLFSDNDQGFMLQASENNTVYSNEFDRQNYGLFVTWGTKGNMIYQNQFTDNGVNVEFQSGTFSNFHDNSIIGGSTGVHVFYSDNNYITNNNITLSYQGILISSSANNTFSTNIISSSYSAILINSGEDNKVQNNDFLESSSGTLRATDNGITNIFDYNFWSTWTSPDTSPVDGIVDLPYNLLGTSGNSDLHPRTTPIRAPAHSLTAPLILSPNGGETINQSTTIQWTASIDSWYHTVYYDLYYSDDSGNSWYLITSGFTGTSYLWDTTALANGQNYLIRVDATDNLGLSGSDVSDNVFTVDNSYAPLINITSNADFLLYASSGTGTASDPYNLTGFDLQSNLAPLISITNTDAYFILEDSTFNGSNSIFAGIILDNVTNGAITNNLVIGAGVGIYSLNSQLNTLQNNNVSYNNYDGILFENSNNSLIQNNFITYNGQHGIEFINSNSNIISGNSIHDNGFGSPGPLILPTGRFSLTVSLGSGIYLDPSDNNQIIGNKVYSNHDEGVSVLDSQSVSIEKNTVYNNGYNGVLFQNVHSSSIIGNNLSLNGILVGLLPLSSINARLSILGIQVSLGSGIYLDPSYDNVIQSNTLNQNHDEGIFVQDSENTTISSNNINNNGFNGIFFQNSNKSLIEGNTISLNGILVGLVPQSQLDLRASISGLEVSLGSGIYLDPSNDNVIRSNIVHDNHDEGVLIEASQHVTIDTNTLFKNGFNGLSFINTSSSSITNNNVSFNGILVGLVPQTQVNARLSLTGMKVSLGSGIYLDPSDNNVVSGNIVHDNHDEGVLVYGSTNVQLDNNGIFKNGFSGVSLINTSYSSITGNNVSFNGILVGLVPQAQAASRFSISSLQVSLGSGIYLDPADNNIISGNIVNENHDDGVFVLDSVNTTIQENSINKNNYNGIFFQNSHKSLIEGNTISLNGVVAGLLPSDQINNRLSISGLKVSLGSGIYLDPSNDNVVRNNDVSQNNEQGVHVLDSVNTQIEDNTVENNGINGVMVENSHDSVITGNNINFNGILTPGLNPASTSAMQVSLGSGIYLDPCDNNVIAHNSISGNTGDGIILEGGNGNNITNNVVLNNQLYGIRLDGTSNTKVSYNDFINNNNDMIQGYDSGTGSVIDHNYWSDHDNTDANGDGIADTPYYLDGPSGAVDATPLTEPTNLEHFITAPTVIYPNGGETLRGNVDVKWTKSTDNEGHKVYYEVFYSPDNGQTWNSIAKDLSSTSYKWETSKLTSGDQYLIKVNAYDKYGVEISDISDSTFTIKSHISSSQTITTSPGYNLMVLLIGLSIALFLRKKKRN
ncbi:MAG: right-handed parallel beta-helix repeat-containing protein, partial [Candidatus Thorarchaeota archaeon]